MTSTTITEDLPMSNTTSSSGGWEQIAIFQIHADAPIADGICSNARDSEHLIIPARESPAGFRRYEVHVDFGIGELRAVKLAHALLQTLERSATDGVMPGYRLVTCPEWLKLASNTRRDGERSQSSVPGARRTN